ncbi:MAG: hypothetical protein QOF63_3517 [Thermoanaerobaculia bacterium]|nr:hypothetical protein [Thermoanaerobaculia bacterium]
MGLFIAKDDSFQNSYFWEDAEGRLIAIAQADVGLGFDETFTVLIEGVACIPVTYNQTLNGPVPDRLNVLINQFGWDQNHTVLVNYPSPPDIIIFAVNDSMTAPTGSAVNFGVALPPGTGSNPLNNNICVVYNAVPCSTGGPGVEVAKAGGGTTSCYTQDTLYHLLCLCFQHVTGGSIADEIQATKDENDWRDIYSRDHRDVLDHSISCTIATTVDPCFPASTRVLTPRGWTTIAELGPGDEVLGYDAATGRTSVRHVTRRLDHGLAAIWDVRIAGSNDVIATTAGHPFLTTRGWVTAQHLAAGDELVTIGGLVQVERVQKSARCEPVYNLHTTIDHTFIVQGYVIAHNFAWLRTLRTWWHRLFIDPFIIPSLSSARRYEASSNVRLSARTVIVSEFMPS